MYENLVVLKLFLIKSINKLNLKGKKRIKTLHSELSEEWEEPYSIYLFSSTRPFSLGPSTLSLSLSG